MRTWNLRLTRLTGVTVSALSGVAFL